MYNNWLNWWYNTVNIKSINSVSTLNPNKTKLSESEFSNDNLKSKKKKLLYILGLLTLFGVLYFIFFDDTSSGTDGGYNVKS